MAHDEGKTVAIAVDDRKKAEKMLKRVRSILTSKRLDYEVIIKNGNIVDVKVGAGIVRIVPMLAAKATEVG